MKIEVYNTKNEVVGETELSDKIFARGWNSDLVHQVLSVQVANRRQVLAHTKDRGEVSGGGKKPWRQKGTGRARHGSIRSPIWKGGGVTFGPTKERIFSKKINKKMARGAVYSVLSKKLSDGELKIIDSLKLAEAKTKMVATILKNMSAKSALIIPSVDNKLIYRATANLPRAKSLAPASLNVYDLLKYKNVFIDKNALESIK